MGNFWIVSLLHSVSDMWFMCGCKMDGSGRA